jgi:N,N'-diacetyllegionaminate synthase
MVFVIAELGVNWDGDFSLAKQMMNEAKSIGCDTVKFQSFNEENIKDHPQKTRLLKSSVSKHNIDKIAEIADSVGIDWFSTPMYAEAVEILEPFVTRYKIREFDGRPLLENKTTLLLEKVLETKKEVFVSSQQSPQHKFSANQIKWLYCVPKYPCDIADLDFTNLNDFSGYSNHCIDMLAPLSAVILGAQIIELHMTSNKKKDFIDNPVSFDYVEFHQLIKSIQTIGKMKIH